MLDDTRTRSDFVYTDLNDPNSDLSTLSNDEIRQRAIGRLERFSINWYFAVGNLHIQLKEYNDGRNNEDTTGKPTLQLQDILSQQDLNDVMSIESDPDNRAWSLAMLTEKGYSEPFPYSNPFKTHYTMIGNVTQYVKKMDAKIRGNDEKACLISGEYTTAKNTLLISTCTTNTTT
jgi:hypothetical protein